MAPLSPKVRRREVTFVFLPDGAADEPGQPATIACRAQRSRMALRHGC